MVAIKAGNADSFLADPPANLRTLLLYGPDAGLVAERAADFIRSVIGENADPLSVIRLDSDTLASDPARLTDEANAQSLFAGRRVIHIRVAGPRPIIAAIEPVLAVPPIDSRIVIEAGDLKKSAALRQRCEAAKSAAAVPCYGEGERALDRLIDEELARARQTIAADARAALRQAVGGDRLASRSEIRKLSIYAGATGRIELKDVKAVVGDAADLELNELLDALGTGDIDATDRIYRRLLAAGTSPSSIGTAIQRWFQTLHRVRADTASGTSLDDATSGIFPRIVGPRRAALEQALRAWPAAGLDRALERIDAAIAAGRLNGPIVAAVIGELASALAAQPGACNRRADRAPAAQDA